MATASAYLIQDENISIHYDGISLVGKNGLSKSKAQKKGGIGGRKALNDISNSAKPSALQASKKKNSANVISIVDASRNKKGGRKALADLTNSSKLSSVAEEQFLHNHQNCIKAQRKAMDMSCFLKEIGLDHDDVPVHLGASPYPLKPSTKSKPESPTQHYVEVEEMQELIFYDQVGRCEENRACVSFSPCVASPKLSKPQYISWMEDSVLDFVLIGTPIQLKH